ncbi:hypothetical protein FRUB_07417 [Fimbriiglobus ruber]|uniref:Secreted protein n=2 Tax=Fimbriiglobus ruber TaxID=1908690 RepID=A0A225DQ15_9BACT|nr:hypothetical protein FRUB_07417 [Fimbriiglobus ruber]
MLRLAVFAAIAVGASLFVPTQARASCGDYVHVENDRHTKQIETETNQPATPQPCHGPNCSRGTERNAVLIFPAPVVPESAACVRSELLPVAAKEESHFATDTSLLPMRLGFRIERPPRA